MISISKKIIRYLNDSYSWMNLPAFWKNDYGSKGYFFWICTFWLLIAGLEFGQDYISSILNDNYFKPVESLSYKIFWLLFIPFTILITIGMGKIRAVFTGTKSVFCHILLVSVITFTHLIIFSFFLFGISNLIHNIPWTLQFLVTEKLSTRLYIAVAVYLVLSYGYFRYSGIKPKQTSELKEYTKTITVKIGKRSLIVDTDNIKWISSDGPYLNIHTEDKKYVVLNSLKKIIITLPGNFRRIHRSVIANIDRIKELKSRGNGDYDVVMNDGQVLRLSRNYTKSLKGILL